MKGKKRMPVWAMALNDALLISAAVGTFMLFDYVMPQSSDNKGTVVATADSGTQNSFKLPTAEKKSEEKERSAEKQADDTEEDVSAAAETGSSADSVAEESEAESKTEKKKKEHHEHTSENWFDNTDTDEYEADEGLVNTVLNAQVYSEQVQYYESDDAVIDIQKKWFGEDKDKITYFTADIYVTSVDVLKTALAEDTYGKNIKDSIFNMAEQHGAVFAVNGDFYGNSEEGIVVRNGIKYRDDLNDVDICVLFMNGEMKTYTYEEFDTEAVLAQGVWQAWCFGPMLLDGNGGVLEKFNTTTYLNSANPRTAIGYIAPGHYKIVTVDGRDEGYSKGATLSELAAIMADEGCLSAYNLDGGCSAMMIYEGELVNVPDKGRNISDIIYIGG
ncbi:phosphodiester glycosidase family protein [Ruminococcus sp.]|uniref:phosphodiester glycosidase family protein n=1 Tax=Ruminococcus sp. TaxID=41978 RepID=UPI0025E05CC5|nr:phosphodiester glycosidase family protein [Ruminococcus sp.]MBQ8967971.1 phosphodiester glycosidase family protein [Ruminococcus sp.]